MFVSLTVWFSDAITPATFCHNWPAEYAAS